MINPSIFTDYVDSFVGANLDRMTTQGLNSVAWNDAELVLHLLFIYNEVIKGIY